MPFSFSRTIEVADSITAIIWHITTIRPGMKKFAERVSGLKSTCGRGSTGNGLLPRISASDSLSAMALPTLTASAATLDSDPSTRIKICAVMPDWIRRE